MSFRLRSLILSTVVPLLPAAALAATFPSIEMVRADATRTVRLDSSPDLGDAATGFDFCLTDSTNGSRLRFNSTTGAYVVCGADGTFEEGVGTVTTSGSTVTLSHAFGNRAFHGLESVHATVNTATAQGQAYLNASSESRPSFRPVTIDDPNINDNGDCSACASLTAVSEGTINLTDTPTHVFFLNTTQTQLNVLQKYKLNPDFDGTLTRLVGGIARNGAGPLSFQMVVYPDSNGVPGSTPVYVSPTFDYPSFPAFPTIGIVHQDLSLRVDPTFWAGVRYNPVSDPLYFPFDNAPTSPDTDVYGCGSGPCQRITLSSVVIRNLYLSADSKHTGLYQSGGFVRYGIPGTKEIVSDKCGDGSYEQINLGLNGISQLYSENGAASTSEFPPTDFSKAFARIRPVLDVNATGLDGKADTRYGTNQRFSAFSFIGNNDWNFCTRLSTTTDYDCHTIPGFVSGSGGYTRIAGVTNGLEASYGNSVADQINRVFLQYNGSSWTAQPLNPVTASPSIGNPEFGFNWFQARSFQLGVAYEYKKTDGAIEAQLLNGNSIIGKYAIDTDDPPAGFNPNLATQMGADCSRQGWCIFGRFDAHLQSNVADYIDFTESPPEIQHWVLGSAPQGFGFGRSVNINGRDQKALYASYSLSSTANQYRLQLDYIDLKSTTYKNFSLGFDYTAAAGNFPLSIAREGGSFGLGQLRGVNTFYSLTESCDLPSFRGRGTGTGSGGGGEPRIPCENLPPIDIHNRF